MTWQRAKNTKEKLLTARPCPRCGKPMSKKFLETKNKLRAERISAALRGAEKVGRPKTRDDSAIQALRLRGLSIREIARELNCSTWSVQRGLRPKQPGSTEGSKE